MSSVYPSAKFQGTGVHSPAGLFTGELKYLIPETQRQFAWTTVQEDGNQVGKFWYAILKQWGRYLTATEDKKRIEKEIQDKKDVDGRNLDDSEIQLKENDLKNNPRYDSKKHAEYFIGPMVFVKNDTDKNHLTVMDGQQRISVLTMIFCIIRDLLISFDEDKHAETKTAMTSGSWTYDLGEMVLMLRGFTEIRELTTTKISTGNWRLQSNDTDKDLFEKIICPWEVEQHKNDNNNLPKTFTEEKPNVPFLRLSEKIKYLRNEIEDKDRFATYKNKDSKKRVIHTYLALHKEIWTGLLTNFSFDQDEIDEVEKGIEEDVVGATNNNLRTALQENKLKSEFFDGQSTTDLKDWGIDAILGKHWKVSSKSGEPSEFIDITWNKDETEFLAKKFMSARSTKNGADTQEDFEKWLIKQSEKKKMDKDALSNLGKGATGTFNMLFGDKKGFFEQEIRFQKGSGNQDSLKKFTTQILASLLFSVKVEVDDIKTGRQVFITLNKEGQPLTTANLVKAHLLDKLPPSDQKPYSDRWNEITESVGEAADNFLKESLKSRGVKNDDGIWEFDKFETSGLSGPIKIEEDSLFEILEEKIKHRDDAIEFICELEEDLQIYLKMNDSTKISEFNDNQISRHEDYAAAIKMVDMMKAVYIRIPIMTAWRHWGSTNSDGDNTTLEFGVLVKLLVIWQFRFKTIRQVSGAAGKIESIMTKICHYIKNNKGETPYQRQGVLSNITKFLLQFDDEINFENRLNEVGLSSFKSKEQLIQLILRQLTLDLGSHRELLPAVDVQVEHVLPKNPRKWDETEFSNGWSTTAKSINDPNGPAATTAEQEMFEITEFFNDRSIPNNPHSLNDMIYKLGNMTLLIGEMNRNVSNLPFPQKKIAYGKLPKTDLKGRSCNCDDQPTPCPNYSSDGITKKAYSDPRCNLIIPKGTQTFCPQHDERLGYNGSEITLNKLTVTHHEEHNQERIEWTALSIMKRTMWILERTKRLWQLPKIYCKTQNCVKYRIPIITLRNYNLDNTPDPETGKIDVNFIENAKCPECDKELEVYWKRTGTGQELDVPALMKPSVERMP